MATGETETMRAELERLRRREGELEEALLLAASNAAAASPSGDGDDAAAAGASNDDDDDAETAPESCGSSLTYDDDDDDGPSRGEDDRRDDGLRNSSAQHVDIQGVTERLRQFNASKSRIEDEIANLRVEVDELLAERAKLIQEVEVYSHQAELAYQLEASLECNERLRREVAALRGGRGGDPAADGANEEAAVRRWRENCERAKSIASRAVEEKADVERELEEMEYRLEEEALTRDEMQKEIERLYGEKIEREAELDEARKRLASAGGGYVGGGGAAAGGDYGNNADCIDRLKEEVRALRGENASLRSTAKRDSEVIASLNDELGEIRSTLQVAGDGNNGNATTRKRALSVPSRGSSACTDEKGRERKRCAADQPGHRAEIVPDGDSTSDDDEGRSSDGGEYAGDENRERCDTHENTVGTDGVSLLFGQESVTGNAADVSSVRSGHDEIRSHAERLLYWANRAEERSAKKKKKKAEEEEEEADAAASSAMQQQKTGGGNVLLQCGGKPCASPIPRTIGLPPRSQSRVHKSDNKPPRCPPTTAATSFSSSVDESNRSDKENGGSFFNARGKDEELGAFPTTSDRGNKKNVSLLENDPIVTIVHNLDYNAEEEDSDNVVSRDDPVVCCECSISPFSGNDPQSEFYLPKLGLACNCTRDTSALLDDRASFSEAPAALSNILRPWQCDFLRSLDVTTADGLLRAHRDDANGMARRMKRWRKGRDMAPTRTKECYVALKVWSRTCKVVLRSIREQVREQTSRRELLGERGEVDVQDVVVEKPGFLDITFMDTHTIASVSTLGQFSSVGGGGRPFEMMEI